MTFSKYLLPSLAVILSGCGWVDSTGRQANSNQANVDPSLIVVNAGESIAVNEKTTSTMVFSGVDNTTSGWSWQLLEGQGNIDACVSYNGFQRNIATNSLAQSCSESNSCTLQIEEQLNNGITQFDINTPALRAPAALQLLFKSTSTSGADIERRQTLCAISINESPDANEDRYSVMRGGLLQVSGSSDEGLLANDSDDIDVRNQPLRVDPTPVRPPRHAQVFSIESDGGFIYEPTSTAPLSTNGSISDSFTYSVTDGTHISLATVSIKVTEFNSAPFLVTDIPSIEIEVNDSPIDEHLYLTDYFLDGEDDELMFKVLNDSLPVSGTLQLGSNGVLAGTPTAEASGMYEVRVTADDGIEESDARFLLSIVRNGERNRNPSVTDIENTTVRDSFAYDVSEFFFDADGDNLYYTAINLPPGVSISSTGVIAGTADASNRGNWLIRVTVNDGNGGEIDDGFRLRIR